MFRTSSSKSLFLLLVALSLLACQIPGLATPTPAPEATEAPTMEAPATVAPEPTPAPVLSDFHSEKYSVHSPNQKHIAMLVEDGDSGWNLVVDEIVVDADVDEYQPVWSPDSKGIVIGSTYGVCYYNVDKLVGKVSPFCYTQSSPSSLNFVSDQYGSNIWFISNGNIYSGKAGSKDNAKKFVTQIAYEFTHVAVSRNGYYLAGTVEAGDLVVFETSGKFVRKYQNCTNATWSVGIMLACVRLNDSSSQIVFIDITTKLYETYADTGSLRPGHMSYSPGGNRLTFSYLGAIYWVRISDGLVFHVSDPNETLAFNPSWKGELIVYDLCVEMECSSKASLPVTTMMWQK